MPSKAAKLSKHTQALALREPFSRCSRGSQGAQIKLKKTEKWLVSCWMAAVIRRAADDEKVARTQRSAPACERNAAENLQLCPRNLVACRDSNATDGALLQGHLCCRGTCVHFTGGLSLGLVPILHFCNPIFASRTAAPRQNDTQNPLSLRP